MSQLRNGGPIRRGSNPAGIIGFAPKLGVSGNGGKPYPPLSNKPGDYKNGRVSGSRFGSEGIPSRGNGPVNSTNFSMGTPVTNTIGFQANDSVPVMRFVRKYKGKYLNVPQLHQIVLTKKEKKAPLSERLRDEGNNRYYSVVNPVMFNYIQHKKEKMPGAEDPCVTPESVLNEWYIEGTVKSEEGDETQSGDQNTEKLLNIVVHGSAITFNQFGSDLRPLTPAFAIFKKVKSSGKYNMVTTYGTDISDLEGVGEVRTDRPIQVVFFANSKYSYPPESELEYEDEHGFTQRGVVKYLGRIQYSNGVANSKSLKNVMNNFSAILAQPALTIFLDC